MLFIRSIPHRLLAAFLVCGAAVASVAEAQTGTASQAAQIELNKYALTSLPVLQSWLEIGVSTPRSVRSTLQGLVDGGAIVNEGVSAYTKGTLLNVAQALGEGLANEPGLRIMSLGFDQDQTLVLVFFMVQRGWQDQNVSPLIGRMTERYGPYTLPILVQDERGESGDRYVLFDLGRFVVEIAVPEQGTFAQVTFATRDLYEMVKKEEGTADLLLGRLGLDPALLDDN